MKTKAIAISILTIALLSARAYAAEEQAATAKAAEPAAAVKTPEETAKEAKMAEMQKYMTPNENHKVLDAFIGNWKASSQCWMSGDAKPEASEGTSNIHWIMDGRFIQDDFKGSMMGKPFEGRAVVGYDTIRGEYSTTWIDSMATGIMVGSAQYDATTKTFNEKATASCPLTMEKNREMRSVITIKDADHFSREMYMKDKDGKEFKGMDIQYERVK